MGMTAIREYAEYAHAPGNAWETVEQRILDYQFGRFWKDRFNYQRRTPKQRTIFPGIVIPPDFSVCDLGIGTGRVARRLIEYGVKPGHILGIDTDAELMADPHFPAGVVRLQADIAKFEEPLQNALGGRRIVFDQITANMVFHLLSYRDYVSCLRQVRKHCLRHTLLFLTVRHPFRRHLTSPARYESRSVHDDNAPWGGIARYRHKTLDDYHRGLEEAGFYPFQSGTCGEGSERVNGGRMDEDSEIWAEIMAQKQGAVNTVPRHFRYWLAAAVK